MANGTPGAQPIPNPAGGGIPKWAANPGPGVTPPPSSGGGGQMQPGGGGFNPVGVGASTWLDTVPTSTWIVVAFAGTTLALLGLAANFIPRGRSSP